MKKKRIISDVFAESSRWQAISVEISHIKRDSMWRMRNLQKTGGEPTDKSYVKEIAESCHRREEQTGCQRTSVVFWRNTGIHGLPPGSCPDKERPEFQRIWEDHEVDRGNLTGKQFPEFFRWAYGQIHIICHGWSFWKLCGVPDKKILQGKLGGISQDKSYYLFEKPRDFRLRPDIVMKKRKDNRTVVLDTKWKSLPEVKNGGKAGVTG